jgi:hypothetical protein
MENSKEEKIKEKKEKIKEYKRQEYLKNSFDESLDLLPVAADVFVALVVHGRSPVAGVAGEKAELFPALNHVHLERRLGLLQALLQTRGHPAGRHT